MASENPPPITGRSPGGELVTFDDSETIRELGSVAEQGTGVRNAALLYLMSSETDATMTTRKSIISKLVIYLKATDIYTCNWAGIRREHVFGVLTAARAEGLSAHSQRGYLTVLKGIAREAWMARQMPDGEYARIKDVKSPKIERVASGRLISGDEIRRMIEAALQQKGLIALRDAALIALMRGAGPRRAEIRNLTMEDYYPASGNAPAMVRVRGKGNKQRELSIPSLVEEYLCRWLDARGDEPGPIFYGIDRWGNANRDAAAALRPLYATAFKFIVERLAIRAGVFGKATPHDFRKTFATTLLDAGAEITSVQEALGHTSIDTTRLYDLSRQKRMKALGGKVDIFS